MQFVNYFRVLIEVEDEFLYAEIVCAKILHKSRFNYDIQRSLKA